MGAYISIILQYEEILISDAMDGLRSYLIGVHDLAKKEKDQVQKKLDDMIKKDPGDKHEIAEYFSRDFELYDKVFGEIANDSVLLNAQIIFESKLKNFCFLMRENIIVPAKAKATRGNSKVEKYYDEIQDLTGQNFSSLTTIWQTLDTHRKVRNLITHNDSNIITQKTKTLLQQDNYSEIVALPSMMVHTTGALIYDYNYVNHFINDVTKFLLELIKILKGISPSNLK